MRIVFPYEAQPATASKHVKRPIARISFWSPKLTQWIEYTMLVDTGADYTTLPLIRAFELGIDPDKDCTSFLTEGVGGKETLYFLKKKMGIKIGTNNFSIPLGFLNSYNIPPLLGREGCLNVLHVLFANYQTTISS